MAAKTKSCWFSVASGEQRGGGGGGIGGGEGGASLEDDLVIESGINFLAIGVSGILACFREFIDS
jgi:hypothetical protein